MQQPPNDPNQNQSIGGWVPPQQSSQPLPPPSRSLPPNYGQYPQQPSQPLPPNYGQYPQQPSQPLPPNYGQYPQQSSQPLPPPNYTQYPQPGQYQPGAPIPPMMPRQQPPRKSRRRLWITIGVIVVLLMICGGIGNAIGKTPASSTDTSTSAATTQATSAPTQADTPTPTDTPQPTPTPTHALKWTTVQTFTGNGSKKTAIFNAPDDWKIVWSCNPSSFYGGQYNLIVSVNNSDGTPLDYGAINTICKAGNTGDNTEEHQGGSVYLDISSEAAWTIQIQELE